MRPLPFRLLQANAVVVALAAGIALLFVSGRAQANTGIAPSVAVVATFNKVCPIMGGPVNPNLIRAYNGKIIGFCCPGCPEAWDRLTAAQKATALANARLNTGHVRTVHPAPNVRGVHIVRPALHLPAGHRGHRR
jgi:hypothetical protein